LNTEVSNINLSNTNNISIEEINQRLINNIPENPIFIKDNDTFIEVGSNEFLNFKIYTYPEREVELVLKPTKSVKRIYGYVLSEQPIEEAYINSYPLFASILLSERILTEQSIQTENTFLDKPVLMRFDYFDEDNDGIYTARILSPSIIGDYSILNYIEYADKEEEILNLSMVVNPEEDIYIESTNTEIDTKKDSTLWIILLIVILLGLGGIVWLGKKSRRHT